MDAYQLTRPILSVHAGARSPDAAPAPAAEAAEERLAEARRYTYQLPLGMAPRPFAVRRRGSFAEAAGEVERALWRVAASRGVAVDLDEAAPALARRLARSRAIVPPAADAVAALLPVLAAGAAGGLRDPSVEPAAAKLAERLTGYLDSRA